MNESLRDVIWPMADEIVVLPGHGPYTTIGQERVEPVPAGRWFWTRCARPEQGGERGRISGTQRSPGVFPAAIVGVSRGSGGVGAACAMRRLWIHRIAGVRRHVAVRAGCGRKHGRGQQGDVHLS